MITSLEGVDNSYYVYFHRKKTNGKIFYVGKGKDKRAYEIRSRSNYWLNAVKKYGIDISIISDNLTNEDACELEMFCIDEIGLDNLCNLTIGGDGNKAPTKETKLKISNSLKGIKQSKETKLKRSLILKEVWKNPLLIELKRKQTLELHKNGVFKNVKYGREKGFSFSGDKEKLSKSLKKYYEINRHINKVVLENDVVENIINDYKDLTITEISKKYNLSRDKIYSTLKENKIDLKEKTISKEYFYQMYIVENMKMKDIAKVLNCSIGNIERIARKYNIRKNGK